MKLSRLTLWLGLLPLMFSACATIAPPQPPSLALPKPPSDLRATRKGGRVILSWTIPSLTTDRQSIRSVGPTHICRAIETASQNCGTPVGELAAANPIPANSSKEKTTASYTDVLPAELERTSVTDSATYAIEVFNREGRSAGLSNRIRVPLFPTLPAPASFKAALTNQGIVLSWNGTSALALPGVRYVYRLYRRMQGDAQWTLVKEIPVLDERVVSLTDSTIEWEKTYEYRAEAVTLIAEPGKADIQLEGDDTPVATILAHDIFPPAVPSGLQAVFSGPGQKPFVDLVWTPVADIDLAGYDVYRHEAGTSAVRINHEVITTPSYRDATVEPGKQYYYSVSSVDGRGNESQRSDETSETVP